MCIVAVANCALKERQQTRLVLPQLVPPEPSASSYVAVTVKARMPNASLVRRTFNCHNVLQVLKCILSDLQYLSVPTVISLTCISL